MSWKTLFPHFPGEIYSPGTKTTDCNHDNILNKQSISIVLILNNIVVKNTDLCYLIFLPVGVFCFSTRTFSNMKHKNSKKNYAKAEHNCQNVLEEGQILNFNLEKPQTSTIN